MSKRPNEISQTAGWASGISEFKAESPHKIADALQAFVSDAGESQVRAWKDSIPVLQHEAAQIDESSRGSASAILEYQLPMEFRRADFILLSSGSVFVLELKGKLAPTRADLDQAAGYARDLRAYHAACENREVLPVLVPMRSDDPPREIDGVTVLGPQHLDEFVLSASQEIGNQELPLDEFLRSDAYRPLPSIIEAARELMETGELRYIKRAHAATAATMELIRDLCMQAARTKTRKLILLRGAPGSGKTLVGLQLAHSRWLDEIAIERSGSKRSPAVFLSGNGPLVEVLQYQLRAGGGDGKAFVRGVKEYVARYAKSDALIPDEHVLIYDEAQRAWDADRVADGHKDGRGNGKSEPELFIEFASRIPDWCVVVALIGSGQEIHIGEEAGTKQWLDAVSNQAKAQNWSIHGPATLISAGNPGMIEHAALALDTTIRFHAAQHLAPWVEQLLRDEAATDAAVLARHMRSDGYRVYISRSLSEAKKFLKDRYADEPNRRYGLLASSRDKALAAFGVANDWQSTKTMRHGPWFAEGPGHAGSCTNLESVATEFSSQGLELDQSLLAWGTDFMRVNNKWSNANARNYKKGSSVRSPLELRRNAYRVLLTRGRDGCVIFLPPLQELDETYQYFLALGVTPLEPS